MFFRLVTEITLEEFAASRRVEATRKEYPKTMRRLVPDTTRSF